MRLQFPKECGRCRHLRYYDLSIKELSIDDCTYVCDVNDKQIDGCDTGIWSMDCPIYKNRGSELENAVRDLLDEFRIYDFLYWFDGKLDKIFKENK